MNWTPQQYADHQARRQAQVAKPQPPVCNEPLGEGQGKEGDTKGFPLCTVKITSYRVRLLDFDNLAGGCKYLLDCCRYGRLIVDDRPQDISLQVSQVKVKTKAEERTEIEIIKL